MFQTYQDAEKWLFDQLPNYQLIGGKAYHPDLHNIQQLCFHLGQPQTKFPSIHIAGTNGKGSTASLIASVLTEAGFKTGLYTSPHLLHFSERISINGTHISENEVLHYTKKLYPLVSDKCMPSFFELCTAMAFTYFADKQVDIAVVETGLGGRLDATNTINPILICITKISFDHMEFLGDTLTQIAQEKAGIIKAKTPLITNTQAEEVMQVFQDVCRKLNCELVMAERFQNIPRSALQGKYQLYNEQNAYAVICKLKEMGWNISDRAITDGFIRVFENTPLRGRWEVVSQSPLIILDTAHNEEGIQIAMEQLLSQDKNTFVVLGFVKGKAVDKIVRHLPKQFTYFFIKPPVPRGLDPIDYQHLINLQGLNYSLYLSPRSAFDAVLQKLTANDQLFIGGSNFVVSEFINATRCLSV